MWRAGLANSGQGLVWLGIAYGQGLRSDLADAIIGLGCAAHSSHLAHHPLNEAANVRVATCVGVSERTNKCVRDVWKNVVWLYSRLLHRILSQTTDLSPPHSCMAWESMYCAVATARKVIADQENAKTLHNLSMSDET